MTEANSSNFLKFKTVKLITVFTASTVSAPVFAQQVAAPPVNASTQTQKLEEIIVTATRRSERAQDIPVSITAISADDIKRSATPNLEGLTKEVVGVQYDSAGGQRAELSIRGIFTDRFDLGGDPSSGIYIDDIYQPRFADVSGLTDVQRVELLRGPQGTLFGRNTTGGAIALYTVDPGDRTEGYVTAGTGDLNLVDLNGAITTPLGSDVSNRLTGSIRSRDGFMEDPVSGKTNGFSHYTVRDTVLAHPSDTLTLRLSGSFFESNDHAFISHPVAGPLILQGPQASYTFSPDPWHNAQSFPGFVHLQDKQISGKMTWAPGPLTVTAILGWVGYKLNSAEDLDGSTLDLFSYAGHVQSNTYSAELRLSSTTGGALTFGNRLTWVSGLFVYKDKGTEKAQLDIGSDTILSYLGHTPGQPFPSALEMITLNSDVTSFAVYGQGVFSFTDKFRLTFGGRYTRDQRDFTSSGYQAGSPQFPQVLIPTPFSYSAKPANDAFDPKVGLEYKALPDMLLYATYSKGYKASAVQATPSNALQAAVVAEPEKVDAYEIGMKSEFFNHKLRLNISAFDSKFFDLQEMYTLTLSNGTPASVIDNAASANIKGIEIESTARVTSQLHLNASYAYLRARFDEYFPAPTINYSGNELPRAPQNRFNLSAIYTVPMHSGSLDLRTAYNYTGKFYFEPDNKSADKQNAYGLLDASITLNLNSGTHIQIWGRNIANKSYKVYIDSLGSELGATYGDRRTYGISVTQNF